MSESNKRLEYYKNCKLWLPKYSNFRQFKFRLNNKKIVKIKDVIRNKEILRKWLLKLNPIDVYYSSGCFLNPSQLKGNKEKNYLLFRDIPFDLDADKPYGLKELEIVRQAVIRLIKKIDYKLDKKPSYILFTGKKGFHVIYTFNNFDDSIMKSLMVNGIDPQVTTDKYRVVRLPLSINKSGRLAVFLTEEELKKGIDYILKKSKQIYIPQGCVGRGMRQNVNEIHPHSRINGQVSGMPPTEPVLAIYITNEVKGTKRFIPLLKYNYRKTLISPKNEMELLSKKYGLNEWFLIKTDNQVYCISLASFDKRRLQKILNSTSSISKDEFKKFGKVFIRTSGINYKEDFPLKLGILNFGVETKKFIYSRPHLDLLKYFNFSVNPLIKNYAGYNKPKILEVKKR